MNYKRVRVLIVLLGDKQEASGETFDNCSLLV